MSHVSNDEGVTLLDWRHGCFVHQSLITRVCDRLYFLMSGLGNGGTGFSTFVYLRVQAYSDVSAARNPYIL